VVEQQHPRAGREREVAGELAPGVDGGDDVPAAEGVEHRPVDRGRGRHRPHTPDRVRVGDVLELHTVGVERGVGGQVDALVPDAGGLVGEVLGVLAGGALRGQRHVGHPRRLPQHVGDAFGLGTRHGNLRRRKTRAGTRHPRQIRERRALGPGSIRCSEVESIKIVSFVIP